MSLGLPCLAMLVQLLSLMWPPRIPWPLSEPSMTTEEARQKGLVTIRELRDHAHEEESQFLLDISV